MRRLVSSLLVLAACAKGGAPAPTQTEILWDTWGVPHIFAKDDPGLFKAFGSAQMASHGNLLLKLYGEARGRAAEYWGDPHVSDDRYVRTMGIPARAKVWYDAQTPEFKADLDAFAAGINEYAAAHPTEIADSVKVVLPVSAVDVMAHANRVVHFVFVWGQERAIAAITGRRGGNARAQRGSNTWAISSSHSASGHPMLLANPHLGWSDLFLFYEAQWTAPGVDAYGTALIGFPTPVIAFNDSLGWSHTVNTYDGADVFRLTKDGDGYRFDGAKKAFDTRTEIIKVKLASGGMREDTLVVRSSVHGPVIGDSATSVLALKVAGLDRPGMLQEWWDMTRAKNLGEFQSALKRLQIPMFNVMYADHTHIFYLFGGDVPKRSRGDVKYWSGTVPGDSAATLWSDYLTYDELPKLTDPSTGWLQNANDPPWTSTVPSQLKPESYPAYFSPAVMGFRPQRSAHMLVADSSITFDELIQYKHSTRMELADRVLDELLAAAAKVPAAKEPADVLAKWDRQANNDSKGAVLFFSWVNAWASSEKVFAAPWRLDSAITTPHGLADPAAAVKALVSAAAEMKKRGVALDIPWGDMVRIRYAGKDLPANGAPGDPYGVFRTAYPAPGADGKLEVKGGDTFYSVVEFGNPLKAKVLTAYGNSTQPGSKHFGDQLELFSKQEMRDVWRTRADVEAHLESREVIK
ncbi:MAG: acylase [Gemmatimonadota bacterium]